MNVHGQLYLEAVVLLHMQQNKTFYHLNPENGLPFQISLFPSVTHFRFLPNKHSLQNNQVLKTM